MTGDWEDKKAKHIQRTYYTIRDIMRRQEIDLMDWTTLMQMITVDYIDAMGQIDNIDNFMDGFKILIMKAARSKRGYS